MVGEPGAQHRPAQPYRAPFALTQRFRVTQAPPDAVTHVDPSSRNAVDIAMPVGTAIHAARDGLVINVAARHFKTGLSPQNMDEANFVQIMHDDGTNAIYAHLQLDTVRVRAGQRIARGDYIANSGNTGFSSGPHLHFVVLRNVGLRIFAAHVGDVRWVAVQRRRRAGNPFAGDQILADIGHVLLRWL